MKKLIFACMIMMVFVLTACNNEPEDEIETIDFEAIYTEHGVYYEVFVRSFADSDGDGVGDFTGIKENIDYFVDLGIDGLWLMPVHPSPTYHGYDVMDYYGVNADYGTMDDFQALLDTAEEHGIDIIIDLVINHSSSQHPWFIGWRDGDPDYQGYYRSITSNDSRYDANPGLWHALGGGEYYAGYFGGSMPDLNWSNPTVQNEMIDVAKYWLNMGVDGFRLDAIIYLEYQGEVKPPTVGIESTLTKLEYFHYMIEQDYPDTYIIGEVFDDFSTSSKFYVSIDSTFNFETSGDILQAINAGFSTDYLSSIEYQLETIHALNEDGIYAPFLLNHDQDRIASILNGDQQKLKLAAEMLLTLPGNPFLYYGEELGMRGVKTFGPTVWDETRRLPLLLGNDYETTWFEDEYNDSVDNYQVQKDDPDSLYTTYQTMLQTRQDSLALQYGDFLPYEESNNALLGFYRIFDYDENHQDLVLVLHNVADADYQLYLDDYDVLYYTHGIDQFNGLVEAKSTVIFQLPAFMIGEIGEE